MSLEKRIKRHLIGRRHDYFAVTLPGFERLCADELTRLSDTIRITGIAIGGVSFSGRLTDVYRTNLQVRTAGRLLMRLARFKATNFQQLEKQIQKIPWELYLPWGTVPVFHITTSHSRLYHSGAIAERIGENISAQWSEQGATPARSENQALFIRLQDDGVTVSLDCSGAPLYRRGIKTHAARAPLRETTAAGILLSAGYRRDRPLVDPMCGAGTFSLEAAMMAKKIPPGLFRDFAFMQWPAFRPRQWAYLKKSASEKTKSFPRTVIWASDADGRAVAGLKDCVSDYGFEDAVSVFQADFFRLRPEKISAQKGLVVLNPPYGRRLSAEGDGENAYKEIAAKLKKDFKGWKAALLVPKEGLARQLGLPLKSVSLSHGGLQLTLLTGRI
ncbi:MAG: RNA methyltransferase [Desulfobacteraceae bacterium]|jgi:putative N6-adenine-specific DNA methylase